MVFSGKESSNKVQRTLEGNAETTVDLNALERWLHLEARRQGFETLGHEFEFLLYFC